MARTYPKTTKAFVDALTRYHQQMVAHVADPSNPIPDIEGVLSVLPHGRIEGGQSFGGHHGPYVVVEFTASKDGAPTRKRLMSATGLVAILALTIFGGRPIITSDSKGGDEHHYVKIGGGGPSRITAQRIFGDGKLGEEVRFIGDHHDLREQNLRIVASAYRNFTTQQTAVQAALGFYDKNAERWGLSGLLSRQAYEALLLDVIGALALVRREVAPKVDYQVAAK